MTEKNLSDFGIKHLSASHLNLYKNSPARWFMSYRLGIRDPQNAAMTRGKAAETAVERAITDGITSQETVREIAEMEFDRQGPRRRGTSDAEQDRWNKEKIVAGRCAVSAFEFIRDQNWGPVLGQERVEYYIDGIDVPVIGYTDFTFPEAGITVDLKCVGKSPGSRPKSDHSVQIAGYSFASNMQQALLYAYPRTKTNADQHSAKLFKISPETVDDQLKLTAHVAHAIKRILLLTDGDNDCLAGLLAPDLDSFYFADPRVKQAAIEIFGRQYKPTN